MFNCFFNTLKLGGIKFLILLIFIESDLALAQNPFKFLKVDYIGAMGIEDWTKGWANWNPEQTNYPAVTEITTLNAAAKDSDKIEITTSVTLHASKVYLLSGIVYVKSGGILNIPAGTIIRGQAFINDTFNYSTIVVQRGGKINCMGTAVNPVVFTSNKAKGDRNTGDWGGIIILGKAINNSPGKQSNCATCLKGEALVEGPFDIEGIHGGNEDDDNSGSIVYTRIEFAGVRAYGQNPEVGCLTLASVGYNTNLKNIQVSLGHDDGFQWVGGAVNSKYLIAFKNRDDDFDTDLGYHGFNQFGIGFKDSIHFDVSWNSVGGTSEGFESDNDGAGSNNTLKTTAVFSNYTMIGPYAEGVSYIQLNSTVRGAFRRGARIRRNSGLSIFNSILMGYRVPLMIDGAKTEGVANVTNPETDCDTLEFRNNVIVSLPGLPQSKTSNGIIEISNGRDTAVVYAWLKASGNRMNPVAWSSGLLLHSPNHYTSPNFLPVTSSPALSGADFSNCKFSFRTDIGVRIAQINGSIKIYPNPGNGIANVELDLINNAHLTIFVTSIDGKVIRNLSDTYPAGKSIVAFEGLRQGVYFVKVEQDASFTNFKLIVN